MNIINFDTMLGVDEIIIKKQCYFFIQSGISFIKLINLLENSTFLLNLTKLSSYYIGITITLNTKVN
jgi:hypothetical protein